LEAPSDVPDIEAMVRGSERALLLTCLWYVREVDPRTLLLTGLTRDGVFLVEHGEVVGAVNNFRFNDSPVDLLGRATSVGPSVPALGREIADFMSRTALPPVRVADFNMSTVSEAS
jgi:predicted Zn-dependent protease